MIISITKLPYGLKNMANGRRERNYAIPESTFWGFLKCNRAQKSLAVKTKALKQGKRRKRTLLPAEIDEKVLKMIRNIRDAGAVINFHTVVGLATGIVLANDRTLLKKKWGYCWGSKYLQKIKLCQKKISDSETLDSSWFDTRNWIFFS